jgi:hypothetical protein
MSLVLFIVKYIIKLIHILSFGLMVGNVSYDIYFGNKLINHPEFIVFAKVFNILLIFSGLVTYLIIVYENKYQNSTQYNIYRAITLIKLVITIIITIMVQYYSSLPILIFVLYTVCFFISPFLRFYREHFVSIEKTEKYHIFQDSK